MVAIAKEIINDSEVFVSGSRYESANGANAVNGVVQFTTSRIVWYSTVWYSAKHVTHME